MGGRVKELSCFGSNFGFHFICFLIVAYVDYVCFNLFVLCIGGSL